MRRCLLPHPHQCSLQVLLVRRVYCIEVRCSLVEARRVRVYRFGEARILRCFVLLHPRLLRRARRRDDCRVRSASRALLRRGGCPHPRERLIETLFVRCVSRVEARHRLTEYNSVLLCCLCKAGVMGCVGSGETHFVFCICCLRARSCCTVTSNVYSLIARCCCSTRRLMCSAVTEQFKSIPSWTAIE